MTRRTTDLFDTGDVVTIMLANPRADDVTGRIATIDAWGVSLSVEAGHGVTPHTRFYPWPVIDLMAREA